MTGFDAAMLVLIALLPGALFTWSYERWAGRFGIGLQDRVLRFVGGSAVLLSAFAAPLYWLYSNHWATVITRGPLPKGLALFPILYTGLPLFAGGLLGYGWSKNWNWARFLGGKRRAPRAWDHMFQDGPTGWMRCKLKSGAWIGGAFGLYNGRKPYAAGYPEPADIYLTATLSLNPETGEIDTSEGNQVVRDSSILIGWEEIEYLEFIESAKEALDDK